MIISDALDDPRFAKNPLVTGPPNIRFYAGVPLRNDDGFILGTLCTFDANPHSPSPEQLSTLRLLGEQAMALLELKRKEQQLATDAQTIATHKMFFALSVDLFCTADQTLHFRYLNEAWPKVLGWSLEELRSRPFTDFVHPDDIKATEAEAAHLSEAGRTVGFENRYRHKNGSWVRLAWNAQVSDDVFFAVARDVTAEAEKRDQLIAREAKLALADERWRALFENMVEGVVVQDRTGAITGCNPAAEAILGLPRTQLLTCQVYDYRWRTIREDGTEFPPEQHPALVTLATGKPNNNVIMGLLRRGGELRWVSVNTQRLEENGSIISTFRDITDRKLSEQRAERLKEQERLVTTGTLAAGVGHEINNPLAYVLGNLEFAIKKLADSSASQDDDVLQVLREARDGAQRISTIVAGLRALAREESPVPIETDVVPTINAAIGIAMHEIRRRASLELRVDEVPPILADDSRLTQILVNLLTNAGQAFTKEEPDVNKILVRAYLTASNEVVISVRDNGPGIAADVAQRMYDPFFTTKPVGQGTGLGLSLTLSAVESLDGHLEHETKLGKGTEFRVTFKTAPGKVSPTNPVADAANDLPKIVFIDDDKSVLNSLARLIPDNYQAITFADPRKAIAYLEAGRPADVVFCDVMMPYLTGKDIYERLHIADPQLAQRLVFVTGGAHGEALVSFIRSLDNLRLQKPFGTVELHETIEKVAKRGRSGTLPPPV